MAYFRTCLLCGANLDPGERCDCKEKRPADCSAIRTPEDVMMAQLSNAAHLNHKNKGQRTPDQGNTLP